MTSICSIVALAFVATLTARAETVPEGLQKATDCMLQVLKTTSGVSDPQIVSSKDGQEACLQYRPDEKNVWEGGLVQFCTDKNFTSDKPYNFTGILPGLMSSPDEVLDNHVTEIVTKRWDKECAVGVIAFTE